MAYSTQALVRDNSTLVNFKQWAKAISDFFATAGWVQAGDTGQVNWATIGSVPTAGTYVYEVWHTNDGLSPIYAKLEYGTNSASTNTGPQLRWTFATGSNGSGALTGPTTGAIPTPVNPLNVSSTSVQYQSHFSGDVSRMGILMWRDDPIGGGANLTAPTGFWVQRSMNSSGVYTSGYFTVITMVSSNSGYSTWQQQTVLFAGGVSSVWGTTVSGYGCGLMVLMNSLVASNTFAGAIGVCPVFPYLGYFDNPMDALLVGGFLDWTDGATATILAANMPYRVSHIYLAFKNAAGANKAVSQNNPASQTAVLMRYD